MKRICIIFTKLIIWILGIYGITRMFYMPGQQFSEEAVIDDRYAEHTPLLYPGDTLSQTFRFSCDSLESIGIAFSYDIIPGEKDQLLIQLYQDDTLLVEQPLPLSACPDGEFLNLNPCSRDFSDSALTISVTNISEDPESAFVLLTTTDSVRYSACTDSYQVNGETQNGSIFCRFRYLTNRTDYDLYRKLTAMFLVFLATLILSGIIGQIGSRWQQRIPRSRG